MQLTDLVQLTYRVLHTWNEATFPEIGGLLSAEGADDDGQDHTTDDNPEL